MLPFNFILGKLPRQKNEWFVDASAELRRYLRYLVLQAHEHKIGEFSGAKNKNVIRRAVNRVSRAPSGFARIHLFCKNSSQSLHTSKSG